MSVLLTGNGPIPNQVNFVDYIQSSGSQYFDTGIVPTANTRVIMDFQLVNPGTGNRCLIGVAGQFSFRWYGTSSVFRANGKNNVDFPSGIDGTAKHTVDKTATSCTIDGSYTVSTTAAAPTLSLYLLAQHSDTGVSNYASAQFFHCQIYEGETLVCDFWPCYDPDGVACLYDKVGGEYLYNAGTGEFTAGVIT